MGVLWLNRADEKQIKKLASAQGLDDIGRLVSVALDTFSELTEARDSGVKLILRDENGMERQFSLGVSRAD